MHITSYSPLPGRVFSLLLTAQQPYVDTLMPPSRESLHRTHRWLKELSHKGVQPGYQKNAIHSGETHKAIA